MAKVGVYRAGRSCELVLESGEKVLISMGYVYDIRIFKTGGLLSFIGIPGETIWQSDNDLLKIVDTFKFDINLNDHREVRRKSVEEMAGGIKRVEDRGKDIRLLGRNELLLDAIVKKLIDCKTIMEIKKRLYV